MNKVIGIFIASLFSASFGTAVLADSGTINYHTGWACPNNMVAQPAEEAMIGTGTCMGATYNDNGSGPLHMGAAQCHYSFYVNNGDARNKGYCFWSDPDGDRIYTDFDGDPSANNGGGEGVNVIAGGTGKYEGISGSGPWKCTWVGTDGELHCNQTFNYELP